MGPPTYREANYAQLTQVVQNTITLQNYNWKHVLYCTSNGKHIAHIVNANDRHRLYITVLNR